MKQSVKTSLEGLEMLDLLNGIPHGVVLLDTEGRVVSANRIFEAVTGHATEEVRGIACDSVIRSNPDLRRSIFENDFDEGAMLALEGDLINVNRKKADMRFSVSALNSQAGRKIGYLVALEDITALRQLDRRRQGADEVKGILGHSPKMQEIMEFLPILARTDSTLLITGETGTGKDLLAEAVHHASKRAKYPFIKVNCGALPETLLESELFGHVRGAYTGAHSDKPGMFRLAQGGTLFLTEIGDLPMALQVKLLTVIDDREFFPLGASKKVRVDVRLITGTNRDLRQMVKEGRFREDLYYRLNVLRAHLPPLRERGEDVLLLIDHFLKLFAANLGKSIKGLFPAVSEELVHYPYPGNVRELRNIIEYAVNVCAGERIASSHLPSYIHGGGVMSPTVRKPAAAEAVFQPEKRGGGLEPHSSMDQELGQASSWSEIEKGRILGALLKTGGNRSRAAKQLGWGRSTLWRKIKRYDLE